MQGIESTKFSKNVVTMSATAQLNASHYGVPQNRLRNFFVMTKNIDFDFDTLVQSESTPTVGEALREMYAFESATETDTHEFTTSAVTDYQRYLRASDNRVRNHEIRYPAQAVQERIGHVPQGENWRAVPTELWPTQRNNRHSSAYRRLHEERPSVTIDTGNTHRTTSTPLSTDYHRRGKRLVCNPSRTVFSSQELDHRSTSKLGTPSHRSWLRQLPRL